MEMENKAESVVENATIKKDGVEEMIKAIVFKKTRKGIEEEELYELIRKIDKFYQEKLTEMKTKWKEAESKAVEVENRAIEAENKIVNHFKENEVLNQTLREREANVAMLNEQLHSLKESYNQLEETNLKLQKALGEATDGQVEYQQKTIAVSNLLIQIREEREDVLKQAQQEAVQLREDARKEAEMILGQARAQQKEEAGRFRAEIDGLNDMKSKARESLLYFRNDLQRIIDNINRVQQKEKEKEKEHSRTGQPVSRQSESQIEK